MRRVRWIPAGFLAVCLLALLAPRAQAQRTFDVVTDNNNGNYTVLPNGTVTVNIFLRETLGGTSTSLLTAEDGLFSAVMQATRTTSPSAPAVITAAARDTTNFNDFNDTSTAAQISAGGGASAFVGGTRSLGSANGTPVITDSATVHRVSIGSFTIQGGLIPLQTTTFTIGDRPTTADTLTWTTGQQLDALIVSRTFTVSVLPEPSTAVLLFGAGGLLLIRRRGPR